jgi:hypothetical protein
MLQAGSHSIKSNDEVTVAIVWLGPKLDRLPAIPPGTTALSSTTVLTPMAISVRLDTAEPLVSICIPVYNGEKFLRRTIASALKQTYTNIEILIHR